MVAVVTDETFEADVLKSSLPVLVDFWAEWCGPCRMLAPVVEAVSKTFEGKLAVFKLDTDENQTTASQYQISSIPCCIIFKDGQEVGRLTGYRPQPAFEAELSKYIG